MYTLLYECLLVYIWMTWPCGHLTNPGGLILIPSRKKWRSEVRGNREKIMDWGTNSSFFPEGSGNIISSHRRLWKCPNYITITIPTDFRIFYIIYSMRQSLITWFLIIFSLTLFIPSKIKLIRLKYWNILSLDYYTYNTFKGHQYNTNKKYFLEATLPSYTYIMPYIHDKYKILIGIRK